MPNRKAKGMTLVEAVVIVVIVAVLFAILIPLLNRAREESRKKACRENLRTLGTALIGYNFGSAIAFTEGLFRCPSTEDRPRLHVLQDNRGRITNSRLTVVNSSYGYDSRFYPFLGTNHAIMADMDGSNCAPSGKNTANHRNGHNVLYLDHSVKWQKTNFCSDNPADNIFTEDPWDADTDSFITDNTPPYPDETRGPWIYQLSLSEDR